MRDVDRFIADTIEKDPAVRKLWEEGQNLRSLTRALIQMRKQAGLTQQELAARAKWDQGFVSRLEAGKAGFPKIETLQHYALQCGKSVFVGFGVLEDGSASFEPGMILDVMPREPLETTESIALPMAEPGAR